MTRSSSGSATVAPARCDRLAEVAWILRKPALRRPRHHLDGIDRGGQFRGGPDRVAGVVLQRVEQRRERRSLEVAERAQRRDAHVLVARRVHHGPRQPIDRDRSRAGRGERRAPPPRRRTRPSGPRRRARRARGRARADRQSLRARGAPARTRIGRRVGVEQQEQAVDGARADAASAVRPPPRAWPRGRSRDRRSSVSIWRG